MALKIDFEVFWNEKDWITIKNGNITIAIHPAAIGHLYGMLKNVRDEMEKSGLDWKKVE